KPMRIFGFAGRVSYDPPAFAGAAAGRQSATGSPAAAGTPQFLETILLQATVERTSAQPERFCRLTRVAIISGQRFIDKERLHFFKTHLFEIARFTTAIRQAQIGRANLLILRHEHCAFDDMIELSNISREGMV